MPSIPNNKAKGKRRVTLTPVAPQQQEQPAATPFSTKMMMPPPANDNSESSSDEEDIHYQVKFRGNKRQNPPPAASAAAATTSAAANTTVRSTGTPKTTVATKPGAAATIVVPEQAIVDLMEDSSEHSDNNHVSTPSLKVAAKRKPHSNTKVGKATPNSKQSHSQGLSHSPQQPAAAAAASTQQEDTEILSNASEQDKFPPTIQQLACQCWSCHATLKFPRHPTSCSSNEKKFCFYAMHVHPLLSVPICSYCVDEVAGLPPPDSQDESAFMLKHDVEGWCHACAEMDPETLLLCDTCPRAFCIDCVGQAHGGGKPGIKCALDLQADDKDALWPCPFCEPPKPLQQLQKEIDQVTGEDGSASTQSPRRTEDIISELSIVEEEKKACEAWDSPEAMEAKRNEIQQELEAQNPEMSGAELKELVDEEAEQWTELCAKHDHRLSDMATSLQDELEALGIDLARCYDRCLGMGVMEDDEAPAWKKAADEELARFHAENTAPQNPSDPAVYRLDLPEVVDDLMTKEEDCNPEQFPHSYNAGGWRRTIRPSLEQVQDAERCEAEMFAQKLDKIRIHVRVDDAHDKEVGEEEERKLSKRGVGGVSRVRRDKWVTAQVVRQKAEQRKPPPAAAQSSPRGSSMIVEPVSANNDFGDAARTFVAKKLPSRKEEKTSASAKKKSPPPPQAQELIDLTEDSPVVVQQRPSIPTSVAKGGDDSEIEIHSASHTCDMKPFARSHLILSIPSAHSRKSKRIAVASKLEKEMKKHQKEGVQFIWKNSCIDLDVRKTREETLEEDKDVGGCIIAHSMGLGKSLQAVALVHTLLTHPKLRVKNASGPVERLIHTVLLVVPVNTLANWKNEFHKWTGGVKQSIRVLDFASFNSGSRRFLIDEWHRTGDVLLVSKDSYARAIETLKGLLRPDLVILDEAHLMLSTKENKIYKALAGIETKRRILLTGSPLQNNLLEYFRMVEFMRPNALNMTESEFDREYAGPIKKGMAADCSPAEALLCDQKSRELNQKLSAVVHRKDAGVLHQQLQVPLQQVILHIHPTKVQTNLYKRLDRYTKQENKTGYLERYQLARPIHNHPACLLAASNKVPEADSMSKEPWWSKFVEKHGIDKLKDVNSGGKVVLLLHILAHARQLGDRVVVFSQCLKTLDFIEEVLGLDCWVDHVPSLAKFDKRFGGWRKGTEYLRIDGKTQAGQRGDMVDKFNETDEEPSERVQLFLISTKAGNVGINLVGANRVVLFDSHFNPTQMTQAIHRCYRFGQNKPVFAYRFLAQGTGEEKIYSRSVNKTGVSLRVIDGKLTSRHFTNAELEQLLEHDTWVQCERCEKWRMLKDEAEEDLPEKWYCEMNKADPVNNYCEASEKDKNWYYSHFRLENLTFVDVERKSGEAHESKYAFVPSPAKPTESIVSERNVSVDQQKELLTKNDEILMGLLEVSENEQKSCWIRKHYFHEALLDVQDEDDSPSETADQDDGAKKKAAKLVTAAVEKKKTAKSVTTPAIGAAVDMKKKAAELATTQDDVATIHNKKKAAKSAAAQTATRSPGRKNAGGSTNSTEAMQQATASGSHDTPSKRRHQDSISGAEEPPKSRPKTTKATQTLKTANGAKTVHDNKAAATRKNRRQQLDWDRDSSTETPRFHSTSQVTQEKTSGPRKCTKSTHEGCGKGDSEPKTDSAVEVKERRTPSPKKQAFSSKKRRRSLKRRSPFQKKLRPQRSELSDDSSSGDELAAAASTATSTTEQAATTTRKWGPSCESGKATKKTVKTDPKKPAVRAAAATATATEVIDLMSSSSGED